MAGFLLIVPATSPMSSILPLLLTASDTGGAGTATRRIHDGLKEIGVNSRMLVRDKSTSDPTIHGPTNKLTKAFAKVRPYFDVLPLKLYDASSEYSINWLPDRLYRRVNKLDPDVIHLNWVAGGYMNPSSISDFTQPIVWRLPDMWPLTGGCHYTDGCTRYRSSCGKCPQLDSTHSWDPSRVTLTRKKRAVEQKDVTVVATTPWLAECAAESAVFRNSQIKVIPNGLNTETFKSYDSAIGRNLFDLPSDAALVLFGAVSPLSNHRKGYDLLIEALDDLDIKGKTDIELVIFGTSEPEDSPDFGFPTHYTGYLYDEESLALLYSAVDVMVVPSRYEGFGQTISEAMACGTPVVAFDTTGPGDIIVHEETGYLASAYEPTDLAAGIEWILADKIRRDKLGSRSRSEALKKYKSTKVAEQYLDLYNSLVTG